MSKSPKHAAHEPASQSSAQPQTIQADGPVNIFAGGAPGEKVVHLQREVSIVTGPVPSADELQKYEAVLQGSSQIIFDMAKVEQQHRHKIESDALTAQVNDQKASRDERRRGQWCALTIGCVAISGSVLISIFGNTWGASVVAGLIGAGGLGSLLMAFLVDHNQKSRKAPEKAGDDTSPPNEPVAPLPTLSAK